MTSEQLSRMLCGNTVLITGGGGTIGSEIARQVAQLNPARIVCLGRQEEKLIMVRRKLRQWAPDVEVETEVCDVRERSQLDPVFSAHRPNIIFHTAAEKDIRDAEADPAAAVLVNVQGTVNVMELAHANDSEKLVFTSSTKAFQPASVMGVTKRLGEMIVSTVARRSGQAYFTVRLSNVLESSGGVHALFRRQIEGGGPVTITHPDAQRLFVTAAETAGLLLEALGLGQPGDILALAAGDKTNIADLALRLIGSYGLQAGRDIDIEYIGLRRGERLVEEITLDGSAWLSTTHNKILVSAVDGVSVPDAGFDNSIRDFVLVAKSGDSDAVLEKMRDICRSFLDSVDWDTHVSS